MEMISPAGSPVLQVVAINVLWCREDEHQLIAHYCQSLNGGESVPVPRSPVQIMVAIDQEQREELESMIRLVNCL